MDERVVEDAASPFPNYYWYTTSIHDRHGNRIEISYANAGTSGEMRVIDEITAYEAGETQNDGRLVTFTYLGLDTQNYRLETITSNGRTFTYDYELIGSQYFLTQVVRPDGLSWKYTYYEISPEEQPGGHSISRVTYPYGGWVDYSYSWVAFDPINVSNKSAVVSTKTNGGRLVPDATWRYTYEPGTVDYPEQGHFALDRTIIEKPNGREEHVYTGLHSQQYINWEYAVGLPRIVEFYESDGTLTKSIGYQRAGRVISHEQIFYPQRPLMVEENVLANTTFTVIETVDGNVFVKNYCDFDAFVNDQITMDSCFDQFGNPKQVTEIGTDTRTRQFKYYHELHGFANWMISDLIEERLLDAGFVNGDPIESDYVESFVYDPLTGNLIRTNTNGVEESFSYYPNGLLESATNPLGFTTTYSNYFRGVAQLEQHQVSSSKTIEISRVVNNTGTVAAQTDGEGHTNYFQYDDLDRLSRIDFPANDPVVINYTATSKELSRGAYRETSLLDGLGRSLCTTRQDLLTGESFTNRVSLDESGNEVFASFPYVGTCYSAANGITSSYDSIGRLVQTTNSDGSYRTIDYLDGFNVKETDESGAITLTNFLAYGSSADKFVFRIDKEIEKADPVKNEPAKILTTAIARNKLGQKFAVYQGSESMDDWFGNPAVGHGFLVRTYQYDSRFFLSEEEHPETGLTVYTRDDTSNVLSSHIEDGYGIDTTGTSYFQYDGLGRLTGIDYPADTADVSFIYDDNHRVTNKVAGSNHTALTYDANGNLSSEAQTINGTTYTIFYDYNRNDRLTGVTYPSGRYVNYGTDALGRPAYAGEYASSISYHANGYISSIAFGNGVTNEYSLDTLRNFVDTIKATGATTIVNLDYDYDLLGNPVAISDYVTPENDLVMAYDKLGRLTGVSGPWGEGAYTYDIWGQILRMELGDKLRTFGYNSGKLLELAAQRDYIQDGERSLQTYTSYEKDSYGNINYRSRNGISSHYLFDDAKNLVRYEHGLSDYVDYSYNADRMRVSKTEDGKTVHYIYAESGLLLGEYYSADVYEENIYVGKRLIANVTSNMNPSVDLGMDFALEEGRTHQFNPTFEEVSPSYATIYSWRQLSGPPLSIVDESSSSASIEVPAGTVPGEAIIEVLIETPFGSDKDTVVVDVIIVDVDNDGLSDAWEQMFFGSTAGTGDSDADGDHISDIQEFLTGQDPNVPAAPDVVADLAAHADDGRVDLEWTAAQRADRYLVYMSNSLPIDHDLATIAETSATSITFDGLTNGQTYYFEVVAENTAKSTPSNHVQAMPLGGAWTDFVELYSHIEFDSILRSAHNSNGKISIALLAKRTSNHTQQDALFSNEYVGSSLIDANCSYPGTIAHEDMLALQLSGYTGIQYSYDCNHSFSDSVEAQAKSSYTVVDYDLYAPIYEKGIGWQGSPSKLMSFSNRPDLLSFSVSKDGQAYLAIRNNDNGEIEEFENKYGVWSQRYDFPEGVALGARQDQISIAYDQEGNRNIAALDTSGRIKYNRNGEYGTLQTSDFGGCYQIDRIHSGFDSDNRYYVAATCQHQASDIDTYGLLVWSHDSLLGWEGPFRRDMLSGYESAVAEYCAIVPRLGKGASFSCRTMVNHPLQSTDVYRSDTFDYPSWYESSAYGSTAGLIGAGPRTLDGYTLNVSFDSANAQLITSHVYGTEVGKSHSIAATELGWPSNNVPANLDFVFDNFGHATMNWHISGQNYVSAYDENFGWSDPVRGPELAEIFSEAGDIMLLAVEDGILKAKQLIAGSGKGVLPSLSQSLTAGVVTLTATHEPVVGVSYTYNWTQVAGTTVTLSDNSALETQFALPVTDQAEPIVFAFHVSDGSQTFTKRVRVDVPVAGGNPVAKLLYMPAGNGYTAEHSYSSTNAVTAFEWYDFSGGVYTLVSDKIKVEGNRFNGLPTLTITDELGNSSRASLAHDEMLSGEISGSPRFRVRSPIIVSAGEDVVAYAGQTVSIIGAVSAKDGMTSNIVVDWEQVDGTAATYSTAGTTLTVTLPEGAAAQDYTFRMRGMRTDASSGKANYHYDYVTIRKVDPLTYPVIANAGANSLLNAGEYGSLDATGTFAANEASLVYRWEQVYGTAVALINADQAVASFTAPNVTEDTYLRFKVTVTDATGFADADVIQYRIKAANQVPVVTAGADQTVASGALVSLSFTANDFDGAIVSSSWAQTSGPNVSIVNDQFTAPNVSSPTDLIFTVTVTDDKGASASDTTVFTVINNNLAPVADAGNDQTVAEGNVVWLDGQSSSDSDGSIVEVSWTQISGPQVSLSSGGALNTSFTAPEVTLDTNLVFELTVVDNDGATATDQVVVTILDAQLLTSASLNRRSSKGNISFDISLSANKPATTYFRFTGAGQIVSGGTDTTAWQLYDSQVTINLNKKGSGQFDYYSVQSNGQTETVQTEVLQ